MSDDHIPDRKPSYRMAVGANTTENQATTVSFQNAAKRSIDHVAVFESDDGLGESGSKGKKI